MNATRLSNKALLVKLTQRKPSLTRRDKSLTSTLQQIEQDRSLAVFKRLFQDRGSPVNVIMNASAEVYQYHKLHTLPYVDAGPRLLPNGMYFDYTQEMRHLMAKVERLMLAYMPDYDQLVLDDISFRGGKATAHEYPTAEQFAAAMSNDLRFMPLPDKSHFLFDLSEEDLATFDAAEEEARKVASADTIERMLEPIEKLVTKLTEYQGDKGQRFHNSIVENVLDGCRMARKLAIEPSEELLQHIAHIETVAKGMLDNVEVLKGSANMRASNKAALEAAAKKFNDYF